MSVYMYLGESHWGEGRVPGDAEMTGQRRHFYS